MIESWGKEVEAEAEAVVVDMNVKQWRCVLQLH